MEEVKGVVTRLGVGSEARGAVKLTNGTRVKGYIRESDDDAFVVIDPKTAITVDASYSQVKAIEGENSRTGTKVSISGGKPSAKLLTGLAALAVLVIILARALSAPN